MGAFEIIILVITVLALSAGVTFGEYYITAKKNVLFGLIPVGAVWLGALIAALIMFIIDSEPLTVFTVYFSLQIAVVVGVLTFVLFRRRRRAGAIAEQQREIHIQTARRMEEERQRRLLETLKGFHCAESRMKSEGQREIVLMSKSGKTVQEIAAIAGVDVGEVELVLESYERYNERVNGEFGTSDLILTPEQEESIVTNVVNSLPFDHSIAAQLWSRPAVRALAADLLDAPVSIRIITAYMKHWGFTVPAYQTIKYRSERSDVRTWLAGPFEEFRKKALAENGEIIWIYTVPLDTVREISTFMPKNPIMLCAVSNDGSINFKVYDATDKNAFDDFLNALINSFKTKLFAVINEHYDDYLRVVGREKLKYVSDKIEIIKGA